MQHFQYKNTLSTALLPLSVIYGGLCAIRRICSRPYKASVPVICIGNVTVGGTGKTPTCRVILNQLQYTYKNPIIVSRGYGGNITTPTVVNSDTHTAQQVGDEPLMLAQDATVVISKNKKKGVQTAEKLGADIIVLDDGLQNPTVYKDVVVVVIDGYRGFGNGRILPSGPLRQYAAKPLQNAHMILVTGCKSGVYTDIKNIYGDKVLYADYVPIALPFQERQSVVPFAGVGNPDKFFETVRQCGYPIRAKLSYPDHHLYSEGDLQDLHSVAATALAKLITTEKDYMRLSADQRQDITPLYVTLKMDRKNWASVLGDVVPNMGTKA